MKEHVQRPAKTLKSKRKEEERVREVLIPVDPGFSGALAKFVNGVLIDVIDMPVLIGKKKSINIDEIKKFIKCYGNLIPKEVRFVIEQAQAMPPYGPPCSKCKRRPTQGIASAAHYLQAYGEIIGMCKALEIPYVEVRPAEWKKALKLGKEKDESIILCKKLYPKIASKLYGTRGGKKDGRAEAILIGHYEMIKERTMRG